MTDQEFIRYEKLKKKLEAIQEKLDEFEFPVGSVWVSWENRTIITITKRVNPSTRLFETLTGCGLNPDRSGFGVRSGFAKQYQQVPIEFEHVTEFGEKPYTDREEYLARLLAEARAAIPKHPHDAVVQAGDLCDRIDAALEES